MQIEDVLKPAKVGKRVQLRGWILRKRSHKDKIFLVLRDSTDIIQCIAPSTSKAFAEAQRVTVESSVVLAGKLKRDKRAPTGYEVEVDKLQIVGLAETFPISRDLSEEFLLDVRHLWLRSRKMQAVLKVRSKVFEAIHDYFRRKKFYEVHMPIIVAGGAEDGPSLFKLGYYGKKAYLSQTWQLRAEAVLPALEQVYTITPAFRAEKSRTTRHLSEYWTAEAEAAWYDLDDAIKLTEGLIAYICQRVGRECQKELKFLGRDPKELLTITTPFPRITYTESLQILAKDGMKVKWGKDLRTLEERQLASHYKKPLVITHYPKEEMAFYKPRDPEDPKTALCYDVICPELGIEIVGGSARDLDIAELKRSLKEKGEKIKDYEFYLDTRRYGSVPHAGFGLGIERVIQWICKLPSIRDAIPFPRTPSRFYP